MGMRNYANCGFVTTVRELLPLLAKGSPDEKIEDTLEAWLDEPDAEKLRDWLNSRLPGQYPRVSLTFVLNDEDSGQYLDLDTWYAYFNRSDLFVETPTPALEAMKAAGVEPSFNQWVTFG